ncbi:MAG TPA: VIT1/CCC1 transporter family protein [Pseudoxanthomonas sp.]|jgi:hypothetical protein|nr:VIT1/CCC1 transporter family protein [Pseudoxanthomonas sp.]
MWPSRSLPSLPSSTPTRGRILDPSERASEILFGLIMTLTFTGTLSVADAGRDDVRTMLIGALGCNIAWGVIDGIIYLMYCRSDRNAARALFDAIARAPTPAQASSQISDAIPSPLRDVLTAEDVESLRQRVNALPPPSADTSLRRRDWLGGLGIFLLVVFTTFPLAIPFLLVSQVHPAMRLSNAVALVMLFLTGVVYARSIGRSPWRVGLGMVGLGLALVVMTIALGG